MARAVNTETGPTWTYAMKRGSSATAIEAVALKRDVDRLKGALTDPDIVAGILASSVDGGASLNLAVTAYFTAHPITGATKVTAE